MPARNKHFESALKFWQKDKTTTQWFVLRMGTYQAATAHSIPITTLKDRLAGTVKHGKKSGPEPYFTPQEGEQLVDC